MSNLMMYADPAEFCERHKGNTVVRRCCHIGNRYIAEMRLQSQPRGFIDYVEDRPDGEMVIEPGDWLEQADLQAAWDKAIKRMQRGESPEARARV